MRISSPTFTNPLDFHNPRALVNWSDRYNPSSKRFTTARRRVKALSKCAPTQHWGRAARFDGLLTRPEATNSSFIKACVSASRRLEEIGELGADFSSVTEKFLLKVIGGKNPLEFKRIAAAGLARSISSFVSMGPFNALKLIGAGCYATSTLLSIALIAANRGGIRQHQANRVGCRKPQHRWIKISIQKRMSLWVRRYHPIITNRFTLVSASFKRALMWLKKAIGADMPAVKRRCLNELFSNPNKNTETTNSLLTACVFLFKVANKLVVSWDKHLGFQLAKPIQRHVGDLLGVRLTMTLTVSVGFLLAVFVDPVKIQLALLGASACVLALALGGLAWLAQNHHEKRLFSYSSAATLH